MTTPLLTLRRQASQPATERLEWKTLLETARDGTEYAAPVRLLPRHSFEFSALLNGSPSDQANLALLQAGGTVAAPLWHHAVSAEHLQAMRGFDTSNDNAALMPDGQLVRFAGLGSLPAGAIGAVPLADCLLEQPLALTRHTNTLAETRISLRALFFNEAVELLPYTLLNGRRLVPLTERHNWKTTATDTTEHTGETFDADTALAYERHYSKRTVRISVDVAGYDAITELRRWLFTVRGRAGVISYAFAGEAPTLWRLFADAVAIDYSRPGLASTTLNLVAL